MPVAFCSIRLSYWLFQVIKEQPDDDTVITKVVFKPDEFGRVKTEHYTQRSISGQIILDYSEDFETISDHQVYKQEYEDNAEEQQQEKQLPDLNGSPIGVGTIVEIAESSDTSEVEDSSEEELLTEDEKKGKSIHVEWLLLYLSLAWTWHFHMPSLLRWPHKNAFAIPQISSYKLC